jgi:hypothetical protein
MAYTALYGSTPTTNTAMQDVTYNVNYHVHVDVKVGDLVKVAKILDDTFMEAALN